MMTKTFWITLATVTALCAGTLVLRSQGNRELTRQIGNERAVLAGLERDVRNFETAVPDSPLLGGMVATPGSREEAIAEDRAATTPAERVTRARGRLEQLVADLDDISRSPAAFFRVLPDVLRVIQDLSLDELFALADGIEASPSGQVPNPLGVTRIILYLLAAEQDPQRAARNEAIMKDSETRDAILGVLGRRDSKALLQWVNSSDLNELDRNRLVGATALQLMREDIDKGLVLLRESGIGNQMNFLGIGAIPVSPGKLPDLVAAMQKPENADFRRQLLTMTMATAMLEGGVDATRRHVEELGVTDGEVSEFLTMGNAFSEGNEAARVLAWMQEVQSPEVWAEALPNAVGQWAQRDYNAAGEWLGKLEPSMAKDIAVQRFVQTVIPIDPPAAVAWAVSIDGEGARAVSLVFAAEQWLLRDRSAAEQWIAESGIDLPALRERAGGAPKPAELHQPFLAPPVREETTE